VVGTDVGGLPEAIGDPNFVVQAGIGVEASLAAKIVEVLQAPPPGDSISEAVSGATWERVVQREVGVYRELMG
jgi:glycosyltransferase involved in cell wall biosynthesis